MFRRMFLALILAVSFALPFASTARADAVRVLPSTTPPALTAPALPPLAPAPARGRFDVTKFPEARRVVMSDAGRSFPFLKGDFEVLDPYVGKKYNCIAHSLGIHSYWVNPQTGPAAAPLSLMDKMYAAKGYRRVSGLDFRLVTGKQKVVVYATVNAGKIVNVTHAALQERDGTWSSKLGQLPLIKHATPNALNGPVYGQPVAVYVKAI